MRFKPAPLKTKGAAPGVCRRTLNLAGLKNQTRGCYRLSFYGEDEMKFKPAPLTPKGAAPSGKGAGIKASATRSAQEIREE